MSVDVHAHCVPADLLDLLRRDGSDLGIELTDDRRAVIGRGRPTMPIRSDLVDFDTRLALMDRVGIEIQVLSSWIDLTAYGLDPARGERWARLVNEALVAEAARRPDRFRVLATVPLQAPEVAAAELVYVTEKYGVVGVEIATRVGDVALSAAHLDPFWAAAERLGSLVLLHPMDPLPGIDLKAHFLHNLVGRPAETTIAIARLIMAGVFDRHPELRVCVVHGGGFLPYQVGRLQRGWEGIPRLAATDLVTPPREVVTGLYYDTIVHDPQALRFLIDRVGAGQIMAGTDYPFEAGDLNPAATIDAVPNLTEAEREQMLAGTARDLLGL